MPPWTFWTRVRRWWDDDAEVYDHAKGHGGGGPAEDAAWTAALIRTLPPAPARVLDCGAGTGFLSLRAAALGHQVTALDLSLGMLAKLQSAAVARGLDITTVAAPAHHPPDGPFDVVTERHLLWTLPRPGGGVDGVVRRGAGGSAGAVRRSVGRRRRWPGAAQQGTWHRPAAEA